MIEIKIPSDIQEYNGKLLFGFSVRQLLSIIATLAVCIPLGVLGKGHIHEEVLPWLIMLIAAPILGWGFLTWKGMRFEVLVRAIISYMVSPQKRVYEDVDYNLYHHLRESMVEEAIVQQKIESGEYTTDAEKEWRG